MNYLRVLFGNKVIVYLVSRYGTYAMQFVVSLAIASKLGPYYLGIYGFITLILSYFNQINLGVPHSLNVLLVHNKADKDVCNAYIGNSLAIYLFLSIIVLLLYFIITIFGITISKDYAIDNYLFLITIVAVLSYFNSIMFGVLRVKNKVNHLSVVQSLNVVLNFLVIPLFQKEQLIYALVITQFLTYVITIIITRNAKLLPGYHNFQVNIYTMKVILHKGGYLFMYNSCFYFILISIRTVISTNYAVEEFGAFTFSFTIAHAVLLLIESLMTIVFPKIIDLLSSDDYDKINKTLDNVRVGFISFSHFLIYIAMIFFPLLTTLLPKYSNAIISMNLIALAILMNTNSYGYSSLLIAKNKEKTAAIISSLSLIINIVVALILTYIFKVGFSYVILATLISYLFFSYAIVKRSKEMFGVYSYKESLKNFFPLRLLIPYMSALIISMLNYEYVIWLPAVVYIILNMEDLKLMIEMSKKLVQNPNISDI